MFLLKGCGLFIYMRENSMWKIEFDEGDWFYRIFGKDKNIAAYFGPDYGKIPKESEVDIIKQMHKENSHVSGGFLTIPLVKFGIFDSDYESDIYDLIDTIDGISRRLQVWKSVLEVATLKKHVVKISHTDQDMLSVTIFTTFNHKVSLDKKAILEEISPILDLAFEKQLL